MLAALITVRTTPETIHQLTPARAVGLDTSVPAASGFTDAPTRLQPVVTIIKAAISTLDTNFISFPKFR